MSSNDHLRSIGERPQERPQRRRRIDPRRTTGPSRRAATAPCHRCESAPATIPATSEATFNPAFAPLSAGTLRCCRPARRSPARCGQPHHRHQPSRRHQIRIVEHRRDPAKSMRESHLRDALPCAGRLELSQVPISQPVRAFSRYGTLNPLPSTGPIGGSGLTSPAPRNGRSGVDPGGADFGVRLLILLPAHPRREGPGR